MLHTNARTGRCQVQSRHVRSQSTGSKAVCIRPTWKTVVPCVQSSRRSTIRQPSRLIQHVAATEAATAEVSSPEVDSADPIIKEASSNETQSFVWTRNWWPLIPVDYLDPTRPKAMTVMGVQLVVWKDGEGQWRAFKDACPHRLAPLSEGRVESDGTLLCSYHAWRFDGEGKCTTIPQSISPEAEANAKASKRSCAVSFPLQEKIGLLWVWPDEAETRWVDAAASQLIIPQMLQKRYDDTGKLLWFMRELPYGYEVLVENLTDPAHVPISHHGLSPMLSRYDIKRIKCEFDTDPNSLPVLNTVKAPTAGFRLSNPIQEGKTTWTRFTAPAHIQHGSEGRSTQLYAIPIGPGKSRVIHNDVFLMNTDKPENFKAAVQQFMTRMMVRFLFTPVNIHRMMLKLFDGDGVFLHMQETNLQRLYQNNWKKGYYIPAQCDRTVAGPLSWMDKVGRPFAAAAAEPVQIGSIERRVLLDRYAQHTAHCPTCQAEVRRLEAAAAGLKVLAAACCLAACALAGSAGWQGLLQHSAPFLTAAGAAVGALLAGAALALTKGLDKLRADRQEFFFTDYVHANMD